jgi:glycosyltransferase involved in cell wall biosynthesis
LRAVPPEVARVRSFYGPWHAEGWIEDRAAAGAARLAPVKLVRGLRALVKRTLRRRVEAVNLRQSRAVVVLSRQSWREVLEFGFPAAAMHLAPGAVDVERFAPAADRHAVRHRLGLPGNRRILLSVRRLAPRMGLHNLIAAMPQVAAHCPDVLLLLGGKGPERENLERSISHHKMSGHVRMLGFIPDEHLADYYQAADLFVLPTAALEGFGLVTLEALACGTPVIGTPIGATPEILGRLDERWVAGGVTPDALCAAILGLLDRPLGEDLSREALASFVRANYTWPRHVDVVEAVYRQLLTPPQAIG